MQLMQITAHKPYELVTLVSEAY